MYIRFLSKSNSRKIQFIQALENTAMLTQERSKLAEDLGFSDFLINNMLRELNDDFEAFGLSGEIQLTFNRTQVKLNQGGLVSSDVLLAHYLKDSIRYSLLKEIFFERLTGIYDFAKINYLSHSPVYKEFKKLKKDLAEFDFSITDNFQLTKYESEIREFMFTFFLKESYIESDIFPDEIKEQTQKFAELLDEVFSTKKSSVRMSSRMKLYIGIVVTRLSKGHTYEQLPSNDLENVENPVLIERVTEWLQGFSKIQSETLMMRELKEIIHFLVVEGWLDQKVINSQNSYIMELNQEFIDYLHEHLSITEKFDQALTQELNWIHYQLLTFPLVSKYEHLNLDVTYFVDSYPEFVKICKEYLSQKQGKNILWENKEFLLYKYIIMLVAVIPLKEILEPCYLCVDFSLGNQYNHMIRNNVKKMLDIEIVFQNYVDESTQLILSDLPIYKRQEIPYILWLAPPRPIDWANFIEQIASIRKNEAPLIE